MCETLVGCGDVLPPALEPMERGNVLLLANIWPGRGTGTVNFLPDAVNKTK